MNTKLNSRSNTAEDKATPLALILSLADDNPEVRETSATSLESGDDFNSSLLTGSFPQLLQAITTALDGTQRVAAAAAWALHDLILPNAPDADESSNEDTSIPFPLFEELVRKLMINAITCDGEFKEESMDYLHISAFSETLEYSTPTTPNKHWDDLMVRTGLLILNRAEPIYDIQFGPGLNPLWKFSWMMSNVLTRISKNDAPQISDRAAVLFLKVLDGEKEEDSVNRKDAIFGFYSLIGLMGQDFDKYMPSYWPIFVLELTSIRIPTDVKVFYMHSILTALGPLVMPYLTDESIEVIDNILEEACTNRVDQELKDVAKLVMKMFIALRDNAV